MTQKKLRKILDKHSKWLNEEDGGKRADLIGANLLGANLSFTDLRYANLSDAILNGSNLSGADLRCVDLRWSDLRGANLGGANLSGANLRDANFLGTHLRGADLTQADYTDTILNLQCPDEGSFIAWKKLRNGPVAKLLITEDAKRSSATTRKCRASKAIVLAIYNEDGEEISGGISIREYEFVYRVDATVYPDHWDEDRWNECSNGIHFFITRKEAEEY